MNPDELIAYGRGYLDGYARGELDAMTTPPDPEEWRAIVQQWRVVSERSLQRLMWDAAVKRDENPTPHQEENTDGQARLWPDQQPEGRLQGEARLGRPGDGRAA